MTGGKTIRIGVVGCGAIAELYHLPALAACNKTSQGIVLADPNDERLALMSQQFSVADSVTDYREMAGQVDGVIVAAPPALHHRIAKWFLEQNIHVLCEKPLTESIDETRDLVHTARDNRVTLAVNQTRRFFPTYQKIRELIAAGTLGELHRITYHDGVEFDWPAASPHHFTLGAKGAWSDTGVHLLDTVCYWLGGKPELVESLNDSDCGPEALATVRLRHGACDIELKVSRLGRLANGFEIIGSLGSIQAQAEDWADLTIRFKDGRQQRLRCGSRRRKYHDFAVPMLNNFVRVIEEGVEPTVSGESTLATIELLQAAYDGAQRYSMPWNDAVSANDSSIGPPTPASWQQAPQGKPRRVLVTGASGFLGGRVVELLSLGKLATPVAAIRHWSRAARVARQAVEVTLCDICDPHQVDQAARSVDAIVHCAKTDDRESIVGGTRNLLEAAARHGIDRFVFLSTAEVYGPNVRGEIQESAPTAKTGRLYGDAKIEAEDLCRSFDSHSLATTILRPSLIYGPFSTSWSMDIAQRLLSGNWGTFDQRGEGMANLIYVDDLVQAIFLSLTCDAARGETFNVSGPDRLSWNEYFQRFNEVLDLPPLPSISATQSWLRTKVMDWVDLVADKILERYEDQLMEIYLRGGFASRVMKRIKGELKSTPSGDELNNLFSRQAVYTDSKARRLLQYEPMFDIDRGLAMTLAWLRLHELATPEGHEKQIARGRDSATPDALLEATCS